MTQPTNTLLLDALAGRPVPRPPVWMMRQAGRYLPDFRALRHDYDFFTRVKTPELAAQITVMPVDQVGVDAAIVFSDILVVPQAMGAEVTMNEGEGPRLPQPIRSAQDVQRLHVPDVTTSLGYVAQALRHTTELLKGQVPLIGFAGAPFTLLAYLVEGGGSKDYARAKAFMYQEPAAAHELLQRITDTTIAYLNLQVQAGAHVVQLFDSWAGLLGPEDFATWALPYLTQIVQGVRGAPVILFAKGAWHSLPQMAATGAAALGLDWCVPAQWARQQVGPHITLQGNFDPSRLHLPLPQLTQATQHMVGSFGTQRYIANLGHGILPDIPVDHARTFVQAVQQYQA